MTVKKSTLQTPEEILTELRALVTEAEKLVDHTLDVSDDTVAALRGRYEAAQERLLNSYDEVKRSAVASAMCADEAIRERPYQSVGIALATGVLIGLIVAMRKARP